MSKILSSVSDSISENNNEYRLELRQLNSKIDEKATLIIGDIVTLSNYSLDFSSAVSKIKENLVNPISRVIESYVIRDLRSVESVNEQFIDKINDKIESSKVESNEEKSKFIDNLDALLNDKYLQIVKIKRTDFFNEDGKNADIQNIISDFINYLKENGTFDENSLLNIFNNFSNEIYELISESLNAISNLYLNNFVSGIKDALNSSIGYSGVVPEEIDTNDSFMPEINPAPQIDIPTSDEVNDNTSLIEPVAPVIPSIPEVPDIPALDLEVNNISYEEPKPMDIPPISPIEVEEEKKEVKPKHSYDVEEILKIAKSPVVSVPVENDFSSENVSNKKSLLSSLDETFNEREVVEEMIRRLSSRLEKIEQRQSKLEDDKLKKESDQNFVNDLIKNAEAKKEELDEFEESLNQKEEELDRKEKELDEKIKNVMPFANAVLNTEEESKN